MNFFKKNWDWMFFVPSENRSLFKIILWWEYRRIPYNLIIGCMGGCSLIIFLFFISQSGVLKPGEDAIEPLALLIAPIIINIGYTAGWIAEIILKYLWKDKAYRAGPIFLKLGLSFSVFIVIFPSAYWFGYWLFNRIGIIN